MEKTIRGKLKKALVMEAEENGKSAIFFAPIGSIIEVSIEEWPDDMTESEKIKNWSDTAKEGEKIR